MINGVGVVELTGGMGPRSLKSHADTSLGLRRALVLVVSTAGARAADFAAAVAGGRARARLGYSF